MKWSILFLNMEQRNRLRMEKDHETEERGKAVKQRKLIQKVYWEKVQSVSQYLSLLFVSLTTLICIVHHFSNIFCLTCLNNLYLLPNLQDKLGLGQITK